MGEMVIYFPKNLLLFIHQAVKSVQMMIALPWSQLLTNDAIDKVQKNHHGQWEWQDENGDIFFSLYPRINVEFWFRLRCSLQGTCRYGDIEFSLPDVIYGNVSQKSNVSRHLSGKMVFSNPSNYAEVTFLADGCSVIGKVWDAQQKEVESIIEGNIFDGVC